MSLESAPAPDERLRQYIAERTRHIYQPLMLIELLGRCEMGTVALVGGEQLSDAEGGICWQ